MELCGVKSLSFAVGLYLPLSTTLPIFIGGLVKGIVDWRTKKNKGEVEDSELGKGSLFATGLVAGGALAGVVVAILTVNESVANSLKKISVEPFLHYNFGIGGYHLLGVLFFGFMAWVLYKIGVEKTR